MKMFEKINLFFHRIDGLLCLAVAVASFVGLIQCALGVQDGVEVLSLPCTLLCCLSVVMLSHFLDWLLLINRKTRIKAVKKQVNTFLKTWRMKEYDEKQKEE